jgi:hypothetical protein
MYRGGTYSYVSCAILTASKHKRNWTEHGRTITTKDCKILLDSFHLAASVDIIRVPDRAAFKLISN